MQVNRITITALFPILILLVCPCGRVVAEEDRVTLEGSGGVEIVFNKEGAGYNWVEYRDKEAGRSWSISGARFSLQTLDGKRTNLGETGFANLVKRAGDDRQEVVLETELPAPPVAVRQVFSIRGDGRTLRIRTLLRATGDPVLIHRVGLLEIGVPGENLHLTGSAYVSCPIFGDHVFAGIEYPSAMCQVDGDNLYLAQHSYTQVESEWVDVPPAVFGSVAEEDISTAGKDALRRTFIRYLDTVRVKPADMHVHYNDWWTAPVPSSERFVLENIAEMKRGLYDRTGFFFDSYALDAGWSDTHSVWEIDKKNFPEGFDRIRDAMAEVGGHPGLWVSPSSLYPFALDNKWLKSEGYEVIPHRGIEYSACLAIGGKYQKAFKEAALKHIREANLAHMKFDGFVQSCDVEEHGHPTGAESYLPIAEGLMEVFDAIRELNPNIAMEPTCFWYNPSPWWLMHVPFIIGPFGDDSPYGRCPCPEWIEAMTTARDIKNLDGRDSFLMPSSALQCFDIIVQCPGVFQNHATMAIGRGRWFISCYINPKYMDGEEWLFFADLMNWARANREFLQEPVPIGGHPLKREAYGYAYRGEERQIFCLRNPWIEEAVMDLPDWPMAGNSKEVRMLYPRRKLLARVGNGNTLPPMRVGPYETQMVEVVSSTGDPLPDIPTAGIDWPEKREAKLEHVVFHDEVEPLGPSWTSTVGDATELLSFQVEKEVLLLGAQTAELCILCEGDPEVAYAQCSLAIDDSQAPTEVSTTRGAFGAASQDDREHWIWFTSSIPDGNHKVSVEVTCPVKSATFGVFLRGTNVGPEPDPPFGPEPSFPLYRPSIVPWSRVIEPLTGGSGDTIPSVTRPRPIQKIDGIYLDSLDWKEASAGWGEVRKNKSVMEKPMTCAGRGFVRGIGTHAPSRIVYEIPEGHSSFAATIGYDQEVQGGSIVFAVEADGKEIYRSPVMKVGYETIDINIPVSGVKELVLVVEDAGDGIAADHADWAEARLLK